MSFTIQPPTGSGLVEKRKRANGSTPREAPRSYSLPDSFADEPLGKDHGRDTARIAPTPSPLLFGATLATLIAFLLLSFPLAGRSAFAAMEDENLVDPTQRADNSFIYDTTIESLSSQAALYDNRTVQVVGEVIGDRIEAVDDGYCWITLTVTDVEDKTSISVLISEEQASQIDRYGKYGVVGTILQVRGIYHQACAYHDGLPDIHATDSSVISRGEDHPDALNAAEFAPGIVAVLIGIALMAIFYMARERTL